MKGSRESVMFVSFHSDRRSRGSGRSAAAGHSPAAERSAGGAVEMCGLSPRYQVMSPTGQRIIDRFRTKMIQNPFHRLIIDLGFRDLVWISDRQRGFEISFKLITDQCTCTKC